MTKQEKAFIATVWEYYETHGRHQLSWRQTTDPYCILVSEVMLQQTQVDRVVPKYAEFISQYPTVASLADAPLKSVLQLWQGLGYNRRAQSLQRAAQYVTHELDGIFPVSYEKLLILPGVGPYTAGAIMAFAYNQPIPLIETNIRTVYLYHFFARQTSVAEADILAKINATLDTTNPRQWYAALMDYGAHLKRTQGNQNKRAVQYRTQSAFVGSDRQIRGAIVRVLTKSVTPLNRQQLGDLLAEFASPDIDRQLTKLHAEGLIQQSSQGYSLPT